MKLKFGIIFLILFLNNLNLFSQSIPNNKLIKPEYLKKGDTVAIVAPSGVLKNYNGYILKAKELLKSWELEVIIGENVFNDNGHFAGTDNQRSADFQLALDDKSIKAIWCARGGYGAMRVIDNLNFEKYKENPKWIIGYSDITAIHNDLHNNKSESIHGIMCKSLEKIDVDNNESISLLKNTLFGEKLSYTIEGNNYNIEGNSNGQLIGGNLTLLHCLLGSESSIDTDGKILFIEDLGEYLYHIDRMLISLKRAGYFDNCKGLIVGDFTDMRKNTTPFGRNLKELILDIVREYDFPVSFGFPAGHGEKNYPMILGREINLKVSKQQSTINFSN
ncbi:MAG: LD-carboxypeptidase [Flavobacteriaceae bacterium]|nr:LD-carboxypeptidase [Flavobacteriaceae bacterium]